MSNEEKKITLVTDDGGAVDFYVLEETRINGMSYLYSILFTFGFSLIVNIFMHFKLKKIDMVESLKSIE